MKMALLSILLALPLTGCVHQQTAPAPPIPGALNQFDSNTYRTLATIHGFVVTAAGNPNVLNPTQKDLLNQLIQDLNSADLLYAAYHSGAASQSAMEEALSKVSSDQAKFQTTQGVK